MPEMQDRRDRPDAVREAGLVSAAHSVAGRCQAGTFYQTDLAGGQSLTDLRSQSLSFGKERRKEAAGGAGLGSPRLQPHVDYGSSPAVGAVVDAGRQAIVGGWSVS